MIDFIIYYLFGLIGILLIDYFCEGGITVSFLINAIFLAFIWPLIIFVGIIALLIIFWDNYSDKVLIKRHRSSDNEV